MTKIVSVIQSKGGTGKTTLCMLLSAALLESGKSVAVADGDPQQSATRWAQQVHNFPFAVEPARSAHDFTGIIRRAGNPDFLLVDSPPGGLDFITDSAQTADLVLLPTGSSPMDIDRTQVTLSWLIEQEIPTAVILSNVDKREKLFDEVYAQLEGDETAALAETVIPTRAAFRRAFGQAPKVTDVWRSLATEVIEAFED
ncbi:ParA family protein [Corynebacterium diphtheriae]|nr:ParA family protein [Corynebacterium diphtheriae]